MSASFNEIPSLKQKFKIQLHQWPCANFLALKVLVRGVQTHSDKQGKEKTVAR